MGNSDDRRPGKDRCAIAIMAKAPSAGRVKTRLSPLLTAEEARELSGCFIRDITANLSLAAQEVRLDAYVAFAPPGSEPDFASIVEPGTRFVLADGSLSAPSGVDGFGRCLWHAAHSLFEWGYDAVALLNADGPTLPTSSLVDAVNLLAVPGDRVVLGPCTDGGYYLLGMKSAHAHAFRAIDWSTARVAEQTRARVRELGVDLVDLDFWYDVDDSASLRRLIGDVEANWETVSERAPYAAPFTTQWLRRHSVLRRMAAADRPGLQAPSIDLT